MDKEIPEIGTGKSGRPTTQESQDIDKVIRDGFILGFSPRYLIQKTGLNKNTVYPKFRELEEEIRDDAPILDAADERNRRRSQYYLTIDDLIARTYNMLDRVEEHIESCHKRNVEIPAFWLQKFTDLTKSLLNLQQKKMPPANSSTKITYGPEWIRDA